MALLHVLSVLAERIGFSLFACGVHHGLRVEADAELELAAEFAGARGVPFRCERVQVDPGANLQARARELRYSALERARQQFGATFLVTAHHADDRAETVLLRLLRGAGPRGLAVLPARSENRLRPLIHARRSDVIAHVERHGVPFAEDPSNADPRFLRTRVRREVLPLLEELSPRVVEHLAALADQLSLHDPAAEALDASGAVVPLNREQAAQLRKALAHPPGDSRRFLRLPLEGGRELVLDPAGGPPRVRSVGSSDFD